MNYTQNHKNQINEKTLIVGVDIAKRKHVARAQDFRGIEYGKALIFTNLSFVKYLKTGKEKQR